jgi:hypothetical protein
MNQRAGGNAILGPTEELVMGLFSRFTSRESEFRPRWLRRWVLPTGRPGEQPDDPELDDIKKAAAADVAAMEAEDRKYFRQHGPGNTENDL